MKRIKSIVGVICAVLCVVVLFSLSVCAVDTETTTAEPTAPTTEPTETVTTTTDTEKEFTPPDSGTLEGVCFTFLTFFFSAATVHTYGDFFAKLTIIFVIFIVAWLFKMIIDIFKKRR